MNKTLLTLLLTGALAACGGDNPNSNPGDSGSQSGTDGGPSEHTGTDGGPPNEEPGPVTDPDAITGPEGKVQTKTEGDHKASSVDGSNSQQWMYFSLDMGGVQVRVSDANKSVKWDLAVRRSVIRVNGGFSGTMGKGAVSVMPGADFDKITEAPLLGWRTDAEAAGAGISYVNAGGFDTVFNRANAESPYGWYLYNMSNHTLSPADLVYAVRNAAGDRYYAIKIEDYYSAAGKAGVYKVNWKPIDAPKPETSAWKVASKKDAWTYLSLKSKAAVEVAESDAANSEAWDIAIQGFGFKTNSGLSGSKLSGARIASRSVSAPTFGFMPDTRFSSGRPGTPATVGNSLLSAWYNYNSSDHTLSPKDESYFVRAADGSLYEMKIVGFDQEKSEFALVSSPVSQQVTSFQMEIDANNPVAFSLDQNRVLSKVSEDDPFWDLQVNRTVWQTNSGTSRVSEVSKEGGILVVQGDAEDLTSLSNVEEAPASGYSVDETFAGARPGSPEIPQSRPMADWYDYNPSTHAVSPKKDRVYVVKTAVGGYAAFRIAKYENGVYTLFVKVAKPGSRSF